MDKLVKSLDGDDFKILKKEFPDRWQYLNKKLAYPYQYFNSIDDYQKPVDNLKKEDFFSKLKNECPDDDEIERTREIIKIFQSTWLESYNSFNTQKRNKAKNDFEKDFFKLLVNAAFGKFLEIVRNRLELEIIKKDNIKKIITRQSKLTFNGIQKSYENDYSYTFKKNEVVMDKAIYVGFAILELSKLHKYETYYDTQQPYFGQENLQLH